MPASPVVEMRGIVRSFPGVKALSGVDLELRAGEVHALLGENGAGKSTLMKILGGLYHPEAGEIRIDGRPVRIESPAAATKLGIAFIHQELNQALHLSVAENIFLGRPPVTGPLRRVDWRAMYRGAAAALERLGAEIDPRAALGGLGVGARQMVEIARALSLDARVLIMDEPTAALTGAEVERLFAVVRSLAASGVAIVYISHRLEEIFSLCRRVTVLRDGHRVGSWTIDQVSPDELIAHMVGRQLTERFPKVAVTPGETLLEVRDLTLRGAGGAVSFSVRRGEIVGLAGLMGAGRTELMRAVAGIDRPAGGAVLLEGRPLPPGDAAAAIARGLVLVPEDRRRQGLLTGRSVRENLSLARLRSLCRLGLIQAGAERQLVDAYVSELGIRTPHREQSVTNLSGGNQQKVILGRWLATSPRLLILDEPTRGIDVGAKAEIYRLMGELVQRGMGIILVSSELPEVMGLSDRILVMHEGRLTAEFGRAEFDQERIMQAATGRKRHAG
ncbi:ABC-type sugar transport system ATPase subunit [Symbiobacterium terraclitae]|uniref:ABC-type sugar transport system ATPase subunit n=1 Tax=Symbiobacterium terraclitae TaxID=557451 RepID=A0ABS4JQM5_9FIRM|nr:sugar ABC transporter ATP-binding protein [Symbiobacterium terraclitae]MBP2017844.1 ABC-type sugar transport system ATPase subunit [Symbiobacterium terraclitae]